MTLSVILGIVVALSSVPQDSPRTRVTLCQEQSSPSGQEPTPSQPGQENPPAQTETPPEQTTPPPPDASVPATQTPAPPAVEKSPAKPASSKPKPGGTKAGKARVRKRVTKQSGKPNEPKKVVVSNGSTAEPVIQISSGKPSSAPDVNSTNSMLDATSSNLKKLAGRQLTPGQQDMIKQIGAYMEQAKTASGLGDTQGAHNLAFKAHLLSEELLKQ